MRLALALCALLGLAACDLPEDQRLPNAFGDPGDILVVTDSVTFEGPVGDALRQTIGRSVAPPLSVADFSLLRRELTGPGYPVLQRSRNVIFTAVLDGDADTTAIERFLTARIDSSGLRLIREGRGAFVVPRQDVWAQGQVVVLAAAGSDSLLADALRQHADTLRTLFTALTEAQLRADMFARARQTAVEDTLLSRHGFAVHVQHDYFVAQDTTAAPAGLPGRFLRLRRVLSDTWRDLWVYYEDAPPPAHLDSLYVEQVTDAAMEAFLRGATDSSYVEVDRIRPVRSDSIAVAGRPARRTRGLWRMREDLMGGPFVRYSFYEPGQRRLYVVYGMVFAPQHRFRGDKREFLRQLEVTTQTFRTAGEPTAGAGR